MEGDAIQYCFNPSNEKVGIVSWHASSFIDQRKTKFKHRIKLSSELENDEYLPIFIDGTDALLSYVSPDACKKIDLYHDNGSKISDEQIQYLFDNLKIV